MHLLPPGHQEKDKRYVCQLAGIFCVQMSASVCPCAFLFESSF